MRYSRRPKGAALNPHLWTVIILVAVLCGLPVLTWLLQMLFVPIVTHHNQSQPIRRAQEPCEISQLPPDFAWFASRSAAELAPLGFVAAAHLRSDTSNGRQLTHVSIWTNRTAGDMAEVISVRVSGAMASSGSSLVTFITRYRDGTSIITSNSKTPGIFRRNPKELSLRVPTTSDVALMYRVHRARVGRLGRSRGQPVLPAAGSEIEDHQDRNTRTMVYQVDAGYYRIDQDAGVYRPTWKGAFLMTWKLVQPFKSIRMSRVRRASEMELKELGLWEQVVRPPTPQPLPPLTTG